MERPDGISKKELEVIQEYCRQHIDTQLTATLEFVPEMLAERGLKLVKAPTWRDQVKNWGITFAVAFAGTLAADAAIRFIRNRRDLKIMTETEKETNGHSRIRSVGGGRQTQLAS